MLSDEKALDHAWAYFALHAAQRITVFNYFVVFAGILCTGLAATVQAPNRLAFVGIALGLLLSMLSFLFWKLDERTSFLVKHAEDTIKALEPTIAAVVTTEVNKTTAAETNDGLWTYGQVFRTIFWAMGIVGIAGALLSAGRATHFVNWSEPAYTDVPSNKATHGNTTAPLGSATPRNTVAPSN